MMDAIKKSEKDKDISEDEKKRGEDEIQKITNDYIKKIDDILNAKEKELMDD
jgi:ribosome recycling factor